MAKKLSASLLLLAFALAIHPVVLAQANSDKTQPPVHDWQGLRDLEPGKVIVVYTKQGQQFEGKFVDIQGSKMGLALGFNILDFEQSDIEEIHRKPRYKRKGRYIGAEAFAAGCDGYLLLPVVPDRLIEEVRRLLSKPATAHRPARAPLPADIPPACQY